MALGEPNPVFLPRKSHGQGSLVVYSPWKLQSWTCLSYWTTITMYTHTHTHTHTYTHTRVCVSSHEDSKYLQLSLVLCNSMYYSLPGSFAHGIPQSRILEWVAVPSSRVLSWTRDQNCIFYVSCTGRCVLYY